MAGMRVSAAGGEDGWSGEWGKAKVRAAAWLWLMAEFVKLLSNSAGRGEIIVRISAWSARDGSD
jgi:hypothetical protein